jgi:predicted amidohydrolase YtcJ
VSQSSGDIAITGRVVSVSGSVDASAVLVRGGRIEAVGGPEVLARATALGIPVRDVGERVVLPGFVDPHIHFEQYAGVRGRAVDCRVPGVKTIAEVLEKLADGLPHVPDGGWLRGYGNLFFDQKLAERRLPTRVELDRVSCRVPIVLQCGGHTSVLNTPALELAQVDRFLNGAAGLWGSPVIELDSAGSPTGVVSEIDQLLPIPPVDREAMAESLTTTYRDLFTSYGVTTFGEMVSSLDSVDPLDRLIGSGAIPARAALYAMVPSTAPLDEACRWVAGYRSTAGPDRLLAAGVKMFADGGYSSRNAATRTAYVREHAPHAGYTGHLNLTQGALIEAMRAVRREGIQLAVHANGVRAQDEVVAAVLAAGGAHDHRPVRIEHAGNIVGARSDLEVWRRANVTPVLQPGFLFNFIADFVPLLLGDAGTTGRLPLRDMLDDGMAPAASSDVGPGAEDEQSSPLFSIWECMARQSYWGRTIDAEQSISFAEALRLHTIEAARALGMDDRVGTLEPGKYGDMVVLDRDPRTVPLDQLRSVRVDTVYLGGRQVFSRDDAA